MTNNRLEVLDTIRGLAALSVVIYHFSYRYYQLYPQEIRLYFSFDDGKYGVQAFFILSGFVIFMTLNKSEKPIDFLVNRFSRLYPVFWFCVIFSFTIISYFGLEGRETTFLEMLLNLTMIPNQFGIKTVDGVYWTLLYELKFYFLMFLICITGKIKHIENILSIYLIVFLSSYIFGLEDFILFKVLKQIFITDYASYFISGILFYKIFTKNYTVKTLFILLLAYSLSLVSNTYDNGFIIISIIYIIFILFSFSFINWFKNRLFLFLGTISYSLYLIHQNIGYIILNKLYFLKISPIISFFISLITVIIIASFISYLIEKPSVIYLKNIYKRNEDKISSKLSALRFFKIFYKKIV
jgi:peptidoglycan/LPS O-acetylase OafA/YrhL